MKTFLRRRRARIIRFAKSDQLTWARRSARAMDNLWQKFFALFAQDPDFAVEWVQRNHARLRGLMKRKWRVRG